MNKEHTWTRRVIRAPFVSQVQGEVVCIIKDQGFVGCETTL